MEIFIGGRTMGEPLKSFVDILDPNFINSEILGGIGTEKVVTIKSFEKAEYYDQTTRKNQIGPAVFFEECLPLLLNATNTKTIKKLFSPNEDNTDLAVGHKIILYVTTTKVAGKEKNCIRIKEFSEEKCPVCGAVILPYAGKSVEQIKEISSRNFKQIMCGSCMNKKAKEKKDGE